MITNLEVLGGQWHHCIWFGSTIVEAENVSGINEWLEHPSVPEFSVISIVRMCPESENRRAGMVLSKQEHEEIDEMRKSHIHHLWAKLTIRTQSQSWQAVPGRTSGWRVKLTTSLCHFPFTKWDFSMSIQWCCQVSLSALAASFIPLKVSCLLAWPKPAQVWAGLMWPHPYITALPWLSSEHFPV